MRAVWKGIDAFRLPGDARRIILISCNRIFVPPFHGYRAAKGRRSDIPVTRRVENFRLSYNRTISRRWSYKRQKWEPLFFILYVGDIISPKKNLVIFLKLSHARSIRFSCGEILLLICLQSIIFFDKVLWTGCMLIFHYLHETVKGTVHPGYFSLINSLNAVYTCYYT